VIDFIEKLNINFDKFDLCEEDFAFISDIHGVSHVFNVMYNVLLLGNELNDIKNTKIAFCGAYIHDLSRRNDGFCQIHGALSVKENFKKYEELFLSTGLEKSDLSAIKTASTQHSLLTELDKNHKHYKSTALLKDADALDRIRLDCLNPDYLRYNETHNLIKKSEDLYFKNQFKRYNSFNKFLKDNIRN
jgi:uncharacterized protein